MSVQIINIFFFYINFRKIYSKVFLVVNFKPAGLGFSPILLGLWPTFSLPSLTFSGNTPSLGCKNSISPPGKIL